MYNKTKQTAYRHITHIIVVTTVSHSTHEQEKFNDPENQNIGSLHDELDPLI